MSGPNPFGGGTPFTQEECFLCRKLVSKSGLAQFSHRMKHVREGRMIRMQDGRFEQSLRDAIQMLNEGSDQ